LIVTVIFFILNLLIYVHFILATMAKQLTAHPPPFASYSPPPPDWGQLGPDSAVGMRNPPPREWPPVPVDGGSGGVEEFEVGVVEVVVR